MYFGKQKEEGVKSKNRIFWHEKFVIVLRKEKK